MQKNRKRTATALIVATVLVVSVAFTRPAHAFTYGLEWMNSWSGCDSSCASNGLSETDDQIGMLNSTLSGLGHTQRFLWGNGNVWASDWVEDRDYGGSDFDWADGSDIFAYSGHGDAPIVGGVETYQAPLCQAQGTASCWFDSETGRWGEAFQAGGYWSANFGRMRWAILLTCFSVNVDPWNQWIEGFSLGLEYMMGYRGLSADSFTTDEVASDWANSAIGGSTAFKSAWFSAAEDLWVDDTAEVASAGETAYWAEYNRDNMNKTFPDKYYLEEDWWVYWAWHEG